MIMPRLHSAMVSRPKSLQFKGMVAFTVDGTGGLANRRITLESGSSELDAAALKAVAEAAPFPPPPQGMPLELEFTYYGAE
jgi:protein TonB